MKLVAAGVSGFLGPHLLAAAAERGHTVVKLVRRPVGAPDEVQWDPDSGNLNPTVLDGADAVINLCGVGVGDHRWNEQYRALIRTSRVNPTALLARTSAEAGVPVLINASGIGFYGPRGAELIDETALVGRTFLAGVCRDWENATEPAARAGVRVVNLRTGLVVGPDGGLLPKLKTLTSFFLGGRLASGKQYFPWISVEDWVAAVLFLLEHDVSGPVNLTAPNPVTNTEFTKQLGRALGRPTPWIVPRFALQAVLGDFAEEVVNGQRAIPAKLEDAGFIFSHATVAEALRSELR